MRFHGVKGSRPVAARRLPAAATALMLVVSSVAPAAALADEQGEAGEETSGNAAFPVEFDPGNGAKDTMQDAAANEPEATAPTQVEQKTPQQAAPVVVPQPASTGTTASAPPVAATDVSAPPVVEVATPEAAAPGPESAPAQAAPTPVAMQPDVVKNPTRVVEGAKKSHKRTSARKPRRTVKQTMTIAVKVRPRVVPTQASATPAVAAPSARPAAASRPAVVVAPARSKVRPGDESHVVQPGESLWSIASALVGDGASSARVAREVDRLWELNKDRIGTGNRNLLIAGTRLRL